MVLLVSIFLIMGMSFLLWSSLVLASDEKMTIEAWNWETEEQWNEILVASGFPEKFPNVNVRFVSLPFADLHTKLMTLLVSGVKKGLPDIIRIYQGYAAGIIDLGALTDLTDKITPFEEEIEIGTWQAIQHTDGRIYQVPDDFIIAGMAYRWDIFEEAGLPSDPRVVEELFRTWDGVIEAGKKLKSLGVYAMAINPDTASPWYEMMWGQDTTETFDRYGNVIFDSLHHIEATKIIKRLYDTDDIVLREDPMSPIAWDQIREGKIAMSFYPQYYDFVFLGYVPEVAKKWRAVKIPAVIPGGRRIESYSVCSLVIPQLVDSDRKEMAWNYAQMVNLTTKGSIAHMDTFKGAIRPWVPAFEIMKERSSPILDNQNTYRLFLRWLEEEGPKLKVMPEYYMKARKITDNAMYEILHDVKTPEVALKEAANKLRSELERMK